MPPLEQRMTIASTTSKLLYNCDGATTVFAISFVFWQSSDIRVIHRDVNGVEAIWNEGSHYTITGGSGSTGTLTVKTTPTDHTPATGEKLLIKSDIAELQQAALPLGGAFPSTTVEQMVDIVTRLVQQKTEEMARSILLPETASLADLRLPEPGAGELVRYNPAGTDLETVAFGDISTAIDTLLTGLVDSDLLSWDSAQGAWVNGKAIAGDLTLVDTDVAGGSGPLLILDRDSASPQAGNLLGNVRFRGRNSAGEKIVYARCLSEIIDPTDGSEDGGLKFYTAVAGAEGARLNVRQGVFTHGAIGGDQGADTINAAAHYMDGVKIGVPRGHIDGLILANNATDPAHDIDVSAGEAAEDGQNAMMRLPLGITKQIDASWAVGTNAGGLDGTESVPGTPDATTWYHVWLIRRSDTGVVDALFSESATSPTMPAGYDQKRRIGAVGTDGGANIVKFFQYGDRFYWAIPVQDVSSSASTSRVTFTVTVPTGLEVLAVVNWFASFSPDGPSIYSIVLNPDQPDIFPSSAQFHTATEGGSSHSGNLQMPIKTNTFAQLTHRESRGGVFRLMTNGWIDPRGKNS
jgi:hypothetical protein